MDNERLLTKIAQILIDVGYAGEYEEMHKEAAEMYAQQEYVDKVAGGSTSMYQILKDRVNRG